MHICITFGVYRKKYRWNTPIFSKLIYVASTLGCCVRTLTAAAAAATVPTVSTAVSAVDPGAAAAVTVAVFVLLLLCCCCCYCYGSCCLSCCCCCRYCRCFCSAVPMLLLLLLLLWLLLLFLWLLLFLLLLCCCYCSCSFCCCSCCCSSWCCSSFFCCCAAAAATPHPSRLHPVHPSCILIGWLAWGSGNSSISDGDSARRLRTQICYLQCRTCSGREEEKWINRWIFKAPPPLLLTPFPFPTPFTPTSPLHSGSRSLINIVLTFSWQPTSSYCRRAMLNCQSEASEG